jgi:hypothetical protein
MLVARHRPVDRSTPVYHLTDQTVETDKRRRTSELVHRAKKKSRPLHGRTVTSAAPSEADARRAHGCRGPAASPHATASRPRLFLSQASPPPSAAAPRRSPATLVQRHLPVHMPLAAAAAVAACPSPVGLTRPLCHVHAHPRRQRRFRLEASSPAPAPLTAAADVGAEAGPCPVVRFDMDDFAVADRVSVGLHGRVGVDWDPLIASLLANSSPSFVLPCR